METQTAEKDTAAGLGFEYKLDRAHLRSAALCMSTDKNRNNLCGVRIEFSGSQITYTATNGHILYCGRSIDSYSLNPPERKAALTIPAKSIEWATKSRGELTLELTIPEHAPSYTPVGKFELRAPGLTHAFDPIDETFPDWRLVAPKIPSVAEDATACRSIAFNGTYLETIGKVASILAGKVSGQDPRACAFTIQAAARAAVVTFPLIYEASAFIIVMPMRAELPDGFEPPEWTK